jgi:hypothetical protein
VITTPAAGPAAVIMEIGSGIGFALATAQSDAMKEIVKCIMVNR